MNDRNAEYNNLVCRSFQPLEVTDWAAQKSTRVKWHRTLEGTKPLLTPLSSLRYWDLAMIQAHAHAQCTHVFEFAAAILPTGECVHITCARLSLLVGRLGALRNLRCCCPRAPVCRLPLQPPGWEQLPATLKASTWHAARAQRMPLFERSMCSFRAKS